jgi:hypothetical protein
VGAAVAEGLGPGIAVAVAVAEGADVALVVGDGMTGDGAGVALAPVEGSTTWTDVIAITPSDAIVPAALGLDACVAPSM